MPIATGERLVLRSQFRELPEKRACAIIQSDVSHCGGISEARRIAAMAETYMISVACHNPQGPVSTASTLHVGFATPNYLIQEVVRKDVPWRDDVVTEPIGMDEGMAKAPSSPGLNEKEAAKHPSSQK
jgi:galactonate dehydratase